MPGGDMTWGRRLGTAAAGVAIAAGVAGCYGPVSEHEWSIQLDCTISETPADAPPTVTEMRREFRVRTALPEWTDPGGGTPIRVAAAPVTPLYWETLPTVRAAVRVVGDGLAEQDLIFWSWAEPAPGVDVTAAPGDEVVLTLLGFGAGVTMPGPGPGRQTFVSEECVPASGEDPVIGRIPVRDPEA